MFYDIVNYVHVFVAALLHVMIHNKKYNFNGSSIDKSNLFQIWDILQYFTFSKYVFPAFCGSESLVVRFISNKTNKSSSTGKN